MSTVNTADGPIETDLPAEAVEDLAVKSADPTPAEPATPEEGKQPEADKTVEAPKEPEKAPEAPKADPAPQVKPKKAGPIADLLAKKREAEERAAAAEKRAAEAEARLTQNPPQPASPQADDKVKALAEKYDLDPAVLTDIINTARDGLTPNPELPQEVKDLIAENNSRKAQEAELTAFNKRVDSIASALPDEPIKEHRDKLMELAYSDGTDPKTGERYADMELLEIWFKYVKPEVEPGKASGEMNPTSGTRAASPVLDFQEIFDRDDPKEVEAMDDTTFKKYQDWMSKTQGDSKIRHAKAV